MSFRPRIMVQGKLQRESRNLFYKGLDSASGAE